MLCLSPASGQERHKKKLTAADYEKWGTLWVKGLSDHGHWATFEMRYESHKDTLFLKNTRNNLQYVFAGGHEGQFSGESVFGCLVDNGTLKLLDLRSGKKNSIDSVLQYDFVGKYLVTLEKHLDGKMLLCLRKNNGALVSGIDNVDSYLMNPMKNAFLFTASDGFKKSIGVLDFAICSVQYIPVEKGGKFKQLAWQSNGKSVAFMREAAAGAEANQLLCYRLGDKKLFTLTIGSYTVDAEIRALYDWQPISISDDGKQVFFKALKGVITSTNEKNVEVWEGSDKQLYASKQWEASFGEFPKLACWFPESGKACFVSSDSLPGVMLSPDARHALLWNQFAYGNEPKYPEVIDFVLKDIYSGTERILLEKQPNDENRIGFSPDGSKLLYYKGRNWWVYDIAADSHLNITKSIATAWDNSNSNAPHQFEVFGNPGWTADGRGVLLYDAFDLWEVGVDGSYRKRLTNGREMNISFRMDQSEFKQSNASNYNGRSPVVFDLSTDILLIGKRSTDYANGYFVLHDHSEVAELIFEQWKKESLFKSKNGCYIYSRQRFDQSPEIVFGNEKTFSRRVLYASNLQQKNYDYGKSELIHYRNSKGEPLKAALFYPAGYDSKKVYPMIVNVYDAMSVHVNDYVNPSFLNADGFNITNFTLDGYFILLPDITYELGNPGISAADCVTAAVKAVIDFGIVDECKIGLIGHSFGGYETDFILTQSKLFAAAVSGAGVSDLVGSYFTLGTSKNIRPEMWRYESQQFRMGNSFFDDVDGYLRNSPILHAGNIVTPTLFWAGKKDRVIDMRQSMEMYLALRRLGIETKLLLYPEEQHTIENAENQVHLTKRIQEWFARFLKNGGN